MEVIFALLATAGNFLEPAMQLLDYIVNTYQVKIIGKSEALKLITHYLLCGDTSSAGLFIEDLEEDLKPEQLSRMGWLEFISGNYQEAGRLFDLGIQYIKKRTGKRKLFLQSYAGIFHLLSLLQNGDNTALTKAIDYIDIAKKNKYPLSPVMEVMRPVFEDQMGLPVTEPVALDSYTVTDDPLSCFLMYLAQA